MRTQTFKTVRGLDLDEFKGDIYGKPLMDKGLRANSTENMWKMKVESKVGAEVKVRVHRLYKWYRILLTVLNFLSLGSHGEPWNARSHYGH
jgi:hypothetical protein